MNPTAFVRNLDTNSSRKTSEKITRERIDSMRKDLAKVRQASLHATGAGDFMGVARLGIEAARINKEILDAEHQMTVRL